MPWAVLLRHWQPHSSLQNIPCLHVPVQRSANSLSNLAFGPQGLRLQCQCLHFVSCSLWPNPSLNLTLCGGPILGPKSLAQNSPTTKCRLAQTLGPTQNPACNYKAVLLSFVARLPMQFASDSLQMQIPCYSPPNRITPYRRITQTARTAWPNHSLKCAVPRRCLSAGANPARQLSLQPVAIGATVEVTKQLKPSV